MAGSMTVLLNMHLLFLINLQDFQNQQLKKNLQLFSLMLNAKHIQFKCLYIAIKFSLQKILLMELDKLHKKINGLNLLIILELIILRLCHLEADIY